MRLVRLASFIFVALLAAAASAQSVRWAEAENGMPNTALLVYENCEPDGQPELPPIPGVSFTFLGRSENMQSVFGPGGFNTVRSIVLSYTVRGRQGSPVQIPAFSVKTKTGPVRVSAFTVTTPGPPLESVAAAKLIPERNSVWAGEVFGLNYELSASRRTNPQISPTFDWNAAPLVAEDWSKPEVNEAVVSGERRVNVLFRTRAVGKNPTTFKLEAANHLLSIQTGTIGFGIISQPRMEQVSVTSDQPTIEVRPLPAPPPGFSGAVGQFKLTSKVVPEKAAIGEPVTWTLELSGTGNWPDVAGLPSREVSNDFQVVQPKAKRTPVEGKLFDVTLAEDVVLLPSKAGTYSLGAVSFIYFDPKTGTYKTINAPRSTVVVTAPVSSQFSVNLPPPLPTEKTDADTAPERIGSRPPSAPTPPAGIPRDPLPGTAEAMTPIALRTLVILLAAPAAVLLLLWTILAIRRAALTDPVRPRREARIRLQATLARLANASPDDRPTLLLAWQHDAALLWQLAHAAPSARAFSAGDAAERTPWAVLWAEADRALYGTNPALPSDWIARAQAAIAAKRVPGFQPLRLFLPQNLMPFAALVALAFLTTATLLRAAELDALASYRKADFAGAEKGWRSAIEKIPTDWIARHNLSLALAQQDRAPEAAAQAAAAFVQHPGDASVRWHFALTAEKAGTSPAVLARFVTPGPWQSLGRWASPANWQAVLVASVWLVALALAFLLINAYGRRRRFVLWSALLLILAGFIGGGSAVAGVMSYGLAAKADAVIVARPTTLRSIPTEAEVAQKSSPLAAGSLALADNTFLGWTRLKFENGQTGWVRKEDVVALWK